MVNVFAQGGGSGSYGGSSDDDDEKEKNRRKYASNLGISSGTFGGGGGGGSSGGGGGGLLGSIGDRVKKTVDDAKKAADEAAGKTDEAVARSFDDKKGGGILSGAIETADRVSGAKEYRNSEDFAAIQRDFNEEKAEGDILGQLDQGFRLSSDFVLDNPNASVQDTVRGGLEAATGEESKESFAKGLQSAAQDYTDATRGGLEDTALDNPVTDAVVGLGEAIVADPAKAALTAGTGVDIDKGTAEGTVGAVDAFDIGVTLATAGTGKAATSLGSSLLKGSDEAATVVDDVGRGFSRFFGGSDEAAAAADDVASAADDAVPALPSGSADIGKLSDDGVVGGLVSAADEAASVTDEAAAAADDVASAADDIPGSSRWSLSGSGGLLSGSTKLVDDTFNTAKSTTSSFADDVGSFFARSSDEAASGADDAARAADDVASASDDGGGVIRRVLGTTSGKVAAGTAGVLAGGAALDAAGVFDTSGTDPDDPGGGGGGGSSGGDDGNRPPSDGTTWGAVEQTDTTSGGCAIVRQRSTGGGDARFFTLTKTSSGSTVALDSNGTAYTVTENTKPGEMPAHETQSQARAACQAHNGSGSSDGSDDGSGAAWGQLQAGEDLGDGWVLAFQNQTDGDRERWFALRQVDGTLQFINSQGQVYESSGDEKLAEVPHYPTMSDARAAYDKWAADNGTDEPPTGGEDGWGEWSKVRQVEPWWLFARTHETEDKAQFLAAGVRQDGSEVYLGPDGDVQPEAHIFPTVDKLRRALEAYFQKVSDGDIPSDQQPTGDAPPTSAVTKSAANAGNSGGGLVDKLGGPQVVGAAAVVVGALAYQKSQEGT